MCTGPRRTKRWDASVRPWPVAPYQLHRPESESLLGPNVLSCVYIQTFPVLKEDIPSFRILRIIANNKKGVSEKEIIKLMGTTDLFNIKLTELEEDNLLKKENSKITLTNSGRILANIFIIYRKLLGLGRGDG